MAIEKLNLPAARKMARLTQGQLAEKCGVAKETVSAWERGISYPNVKNVVKICKVLNLDFDEIDFFA